MKIDVLICTYNRHQLLRKALKSILLDADEQPDQLVIVNGGTQEADAVVEEFLPADGVDILLITTQNVNLAVSRNIGLKHCTGDIIAMTDDDAEVFPDWIRQIKRLHEEIPSAGAIGGAVYPRQKQTVTSLVADVTTFPSWPERKTVRTLPGVNISYKKAVLDSIGMQDETLFRGEDVDYNWRVQQAGYSIVYDPAMKVHHYHRPTMKGVLRQHYMYGRAYYLVRKKWPDMYCLYPRSMKSMKDVLKAGNIILSLFYQPLLSSRRISGVFNKIRALPGFFLVGVAWRCGVLRQALTGKAKAGENTA